MMEGNCDMHFNSLGANYKTRYWANNFPRLMGSQTREKEFQDKILTKQLPSFDNITKVVVNYLCLLENISIPLIYRTSIRLQLTFQCLYGKNHTRLLLFLWDGSMKKENITHDVVVGVTLENLRTCTCCKFKKCFKKRVLIFRQTSLHTSFWWLSKLGQSMVG